MYGIGTLCENKLMKKKVIIPKVLLPNLLNRYKI